MVDLFKVSNGHTAKISINFEENGLIKRKEDPPNRRRKIVELTDKGLEKTELIINTIEHEKKQLKRLLFKFLCGE